MALKRFQLTSWRRFLVVHLTLHLFLVLAQCAEETDEAYKNGRNLMLEYFLPINFAPAAIEPVKDRGKRDVEGSGEGEPILSEKVEEGEETDNATQNAFAQVIKESDKTFRNLPNVEGSGEVEDSSEEEKDSSSAIPIIEESEELTTTESEVSASTERETEAVSTEMIFDKSEDYTEKIDTTTTNEEINVTEEDKSVTETTTDGVECDHTTETPPVENITQTVVEESTTENPNTTTTVLDEETTTTPPTEQPTTPTVVLTETTTQSVVTETTTTLPTVIPNIVPETTIIPSTAPEETTPPPTVTPIVPPETTFHPKIIISQEASSPPAVPVETTPTSTQGLPVEEKPLLTTPEPVVEEVFKEVKTIHKDLEATPGNILRKENLTLGADPLLIVNTRIMDSEENVQLSSSEPKRLGAYIVIGLILLSFSSLVGYITFRKRLNRKRQEFESNQESHDTEKALLSLSDYKDNADLEENHLKNNEITPIVVKSNTQINKFEKNTNFSSPKNLNTIANEKNIEKDNVLKSTAENLTQVIIEDSPKDVDENMPCMEKLIVKTRIDQDSIPKKPILITRSSAGYVPIPQDNS